MNFEFNQQANANISANNTTQNSIEMPNRLSGTADLNSLLSTADFNTLEKVFSCPPSKISSNDQVAKDPAIRNFTSSSSPLNEGRHWIGGGNSGGGIGVGALSVPPYSPLSPANTIYKQYEDDRRHRLQIRNGHPLKMCTNCGTTSTPSWRRCSEGKNLLCNACGLYQKLHNKSRPFIITTDGSVKVQRQGVSETTICANCQTMETPLWRRGLEGECLCNACGLYLKQHQRYRQVRRNEVEVGENLQSNDYPQSTPNSYSDVHSNGRLDENYERSFQMQQNSFSNDANSETVPGIPWSSTDNMQILTDRQLHYPFFRTPTSPSIENLTNDLYVNRNVPCSYSHFSSLEDRELYEKLLYLEDAAAILLSSCEQPKETNK